MIPIQVPLEGWALRPTLLPALMAFLIAPPVSLRAWLAVKALAPPAALDPAKERGRKWRKAAHCLGVFSIVFGLEYYFIANADDSSMDHFVKVFFTFLIQLALMSVLADFSGAYKWAAYRAPSGRTLWRIAPGTLSHVRTVGVVLLSGAINAQSWIAPNAFISFAISTALICRFVSQSHYKTLSIRGIMLGFFVWIAATVILSALMIALILRVQESDPNTVTIQVVDEPSGFSPRVQELAQLLVGIVFAAGPGILIAACYRFDYAHHLLTLDLPFPEPESAERRLCPSRRRACNRSSCTDAVPLAPGTVMPSSTPRGFSRTLYLTSLSSWLLTQLAITAIFATAYVPEEIKKNSTSVELVGVFVTLPVMVVSVLVGAVVTGRGKAMWRYKEEWMVLPKVEEQGAIKLEEEEEEQVPAYEVLAEDEKVVKA